MSVVFAVEFPSKRVAFSVLMICCGTAWAGLNGHQFAPFGMCLMLLAEVAEGTKLVLTQKLLKDCKFSVLEGLYRMSPISAIWLWGVSLFLEVPSILKEAKYTLISDHLGIFLSCMILGFGVNIITFLVIKYTNAVTLKVIGVAR